MRPPDLARWKLVEHERYSLRLPPSWRSSPAEEPGAWTALSDDGRIRLVVALRDDVAPLDARDLIDHARTALVAGADRVVADPPALDAEGGRSARVVVSRREGGARRLQDVFLLADERRLLALDFELAEEDHAAVVEALELVARSVSLEGTGSFGFAPLEAAR